MEKTRMLGRFLMLGVISTIISVLSVLVLTGAGQEIPERLHSEGAGRYSVTEAADTSERVSGSEDAGYYRITSEERELICQVVSAESRGESYDGQRAVAQCILMACKEGGLSPAEAIREYKYTSARCEPTDSVRAAVSAVFDGGELVTDAPIIYFYNPSMVDSAFHESQEFIVEIGSHRFFKEASDA